MEIKSANYTVEKANSFKQNSRQWIKTTLAGREFVHNESIQSIMNRVNEIDFTPHGFKLEKEYLWSRDKINHAIELYKEWLVLQVLYEDLSFAPSELIDEMWHVHILDTRKYMTDCQFIKGEYIHHYPYFGLTDQENSCVLESGYALTKALYLHHFNREHLGYSGAQSASCGCRSGNGSSCR